MKRRTRFGMESRAILQWKKLERLREYDQEEGEEEEEAT